MKGGSSSIVGGRKALLRARNCGYKYQVIATKLNTRAVLHYCGGNIGKAFTKSNGSPL